MPATAEDCRGADLFIVTVPTPVDGANRPELSPLLSATRTVGRLLSADRPAVVVFESTVYPGVTDDICAPELERASGLRRGEHFRLGYSPERINPGDQVHRVDTITKVVAAEDPATLDLLARVYGAVNGATSSARPPSRPRKPPRSSRTPSATSTSPS